MAIHSSVLAWRIPGMGEPGGLQSIGWQSPSWLSMYTHRDMCQSQETDAPYSIQKRLGDVLGGAVGRNPSASTGDTGSVPAWEDFTCHWAPKPAYVAATTEPSCPEPVPCDSRRHCNGKPVQNQLRVTLARSPQLEKAQAQQQEPVHPKIKPCKHAL